jgi:putative ABC transport system permease protein
MNLNIGPIIKTLGHNKIISLLIAVQIAVTMAVISNGVFILVQRYQLVNEDHGYDVGNLIVVKNHLYDEGINKKNLLLEDIDEIKSISGVRNVSHVSTPPFLNIGSFFPVRSVPDDNAEKTDISYYRVDEQGLDTFGMNLIAGEWFSKEEVIYPDETDYPDALDSYIISSQLADRLFPDTPYTEIIGKHAYYTSGTPLVIRGIVENAPPQYTHWENYKLTVFDQFLSNATQYYYLVAAHPGEMTDVITSLNDKFVGKTPGRIIEKIQPLADLHQVAYQEDIGLMNTLIVTMLILILITAFGIVGLTNFSVASRTKQIGTRRALGASKGDILRYFVVENLIVTTIGVIIGIILTIAVNIILVNQVSIEKLDWFYIPLSVISMWLISILAVYWPAYKAASIQPGLATRNAQ